MLVNTTALINSNDYQLKLDEIRYDQWNPSTGERQYCLFLNLSMPLRGGSRSLAKYKMEPFVTIVIASSC